MKETMGGEDKSDAITCTCKQEQTRPERVREGALAVLRVLRGAFKQRISTSSAKSATQLSYGGCLRLKTPNYNGSFVVQRKNGCDK